MVAEKYHQGHPVFYPHQVNDGLELLRKHISKNSKIVAIDFSNPFPFALELPPPDGGASVNDNHHLEPEKMFKGANIVMIAKDSDNHKTVDRLRKYYDKYLEQNFTLIDSSKSWELLKRKNS